MADVPKEVRHLAETVRLIAVGEARVAEQKQRIEELRRDGHPTSVAEQTLEALQLTVSSLRDTKASIEDVLRNVEQGKLPRGPL